MDYSVILASVTSVVGVLIGIILGHIFDIRKANKRENFEYNLSIYNEYKRVSAEIIEAVTPLTSLGLKPRGLSSEQLSVSSKNISELYFKYYTYLPQIVLNEMNCLHSCLQSRGRRIFCIKDKKYSIVRKMMQKNYSEIRLLSVKKKKSKM